MTQSLGASCTPFPANCPPKLGTISPTLPSKSGTPPEQRQTSPQTNVWRRESWQPERTELSLGRPPPGILSFVLFCSRCRPPWSCGESLREGPGPPSLQSPPCAQSSWSLLLLEQSVVNHAVQPTKEGVFGLSLTARSIITKRPVTLWSSCVSCWHVWLHKTPLQGPVCVCTSTGNRGVWLSSLASQYLSQFRRKFAQAISASTPHGAQPNARDSAWRWIAAVLAATTQQVGPAPRPLRCPDTLSIWR